jgi:predicted MFS family arabinose efflux permease
MPCVSALVTLCAPNEKTGLCVGVLRVSTIASLMLGPPIAYSVINNINYSFLFVALFFVGLMGFFLILFIKSPRSNPVFPSTLEQPTHELPRNRVKALVSVSPVLATQFVVALAFGAPYFFGMVFMETAFPGENGGSLFVLLSFGGLIAGLLAGKVFDKKGVGLTMVFSLLLMSGGFGLLALFGALFVVFAAALLIGLGYYGCNVAAIGFIGVHSGGQSRGFMMSLQQNSLDLGLAAGSVTFGVLPLVGEGSRMVFIVVAGTLLCSLFIWFIGSLKGGGFHGGDKPIH